MKTDRSPRIALALLSALALFSSSIQAQSVSQPPATSTTSPNSAADEETIELSPFTVTATEDSDTYQVRDTLAGARVRTDLKDIAAALTVVSSKFLRDTGAKNNQDLLVYMSNTEVGGVYGNYAGVGGTFIDGANESANFLRPSHNTRVRGLDSADNTRDYFATEIPWDAYNVDRIDLQRGPNSILFGFGSPAGIINSSINTAGYKTQGEFENRFGSFGSVRNSFDYNYVVRPNEIAVRFSALDDDTRFRQEPAYNYDRRLFGAIRIDPKFLNSGSARTTLRANYEWGKVTANRPRSLPPIDRITPFFDPNGINRQTFDVYQAWQWGIVPYSSSALRDGQTKQHWMVQGKGIGGVNTPLFVYDSPGAASPIDAYQASPNTIFGLASNGNIDRSIDGFPYGDHIGIGTFRQFADNYNRYGPDVGKPAAEQLYPAADKGFYKAKSLTDPSIFNFFDNLIDGPNKMEWQNWDAANVVLTQTFLKNRLGFEAVYDYQSYDDGQQRNINNPYISVDIESNLMRYPWAYTASSEGPNLVVPNPNAGRAFIGSSAKNSGNSSNDIIRKNFRFTGYGEIRADDFMEKSFASRLLGRHIVTGLYSKDRYEGSTSNWVRYALDPTYSNAIGKGPDGDTAGGLQTGDRVIDWITYLSPDLRSRNSAAGLNLDRIRDIQSPSGKVDLPYFDSHWAATGVNPADFWRNIARDEDSTQSENPRNYAGWKTGEFTIYNADIGDRDRLLTDISNVRKTTTSRGGVWQAYLWDGTVVGTFGYRKDRQVNSSSSQSYQTAQGGLGPIQAGLGAETEGSSRSWGIVVHTPRSIRERMPWGTNLSFTYSHGENTRVENRFGFDAKQLPNSKGKTRDVGFVISTLDDRLTLKATWYKTNVQDANLSSVTTEVSTLGSNTYYLKNLEAWGVASALLNLGGRAGAAQGWEWYWNWAMIAGEPGTGNQAWNAAYWDPSPTGTAESRARFNAHPETIKQTAAINSWLEQLPDQSWFDAYGFPVDVAKAKAGDYAGAVEGWTPTAGVGGVQPADGGRIAGTWPTGTVHNESKGVEIEIIGEPIRGWNIALNITKTYAQQTGLGESLKQYIEDTYAKYQTPAGDLRLWWGQDKTFRDYFTENIWSAYQFQLQSNGRLVPEMTPWRYNLTTNYDFRTGRLKGLNIGGAYRWQDKTIIGYGLNSARDNLDINKPFWSEKQDYIDLWAGYSRNITEKINWRVQLNLRNVGKDVRLLPISLQPDGSPAAFRIHEGMTWSLTNTFSF